MEQTKDNLEQLLEDIKYSNVLIKEDTDLKDGEYPYLLLDMMVADEVNANGRRYPFEEVEAALVPYRESIKEGLGTAIMLADHPPKDTKPSIKDAAGFVSDVFLEGKVLKGKVKLLETLQGDNVHAIVKAGGRVGVSSRGLGKLVKVQEDGKLISDVRNLVLKGFDFVVFPSLGNKSMSQELVYEDLKDDVCKVFPDLIKDITELKEAVQSIKEQIESDDIDAIKLKLVDDLAKKSLSNVFINDIKTSQEQNLIKEDTDIMTLQDFQEKHPELYEEFAKEVAQELSDKMKSEITESITKDVTDKVTAEVTETVTASVKESVTKELNEAHEADKAELQKKLDDINASLEESSTKIEESEKALEESKETSQPYIDILEGLVDFMREKKLLVQEDEVVKDAVKREEVTEADSELKKVQEEMTTVINEQKTKLEEAIAKIGELEELKTKLNEEKKTLEEAAAKSAVEAAVSDILAKDPKYATLLESKLRGACCVDDVKSIYEAEKEFILKIEKLNGSKEEVPTGEATVQEEEEVKEETKTTVVESENTPSDTIESLRAYQQKLAGIKI